MNLLGNPEALNEWREEKQQRIEEATQAFLHDQAAMVADLLRRLRRLDEALSPYYDSSDLGTEKESVLNFLHRRRQETV
jgi:hypothetical protein